MILESLKLLGKKAEAILLPKRRGYHCKRKLVVRGKRVVAELKNDTLIYEAECGQEADCVLRVRDSSD